MQTHHVYKRTETSSALPACVSPFLLLETPAATAAAAATVAAAAPTSSPTAGKGGGAEVGGEPGAGEEGPLSLEGTGGGGGGVDGLGGSSEAFRSTPPLSFASGVAG